MLQHLTPTETAIEELARAETDPAQRARFTPLRWGFLGNLTLLAFAGGVGLMHALLAALWRRASAPFRDGTR